jgi:hypothetical protein
MDIPAKIVELLCQRAPDASICPSEAARALADNETDWRGLMQPVREAAAELAREGRIVITQGNSRLDPAHIGNGPIRLRRGPAWSPLRSVSGGRP